MYHPVARHMLSKPPSKRFEMSMAKMGERERKKERKKESGRVKETVTVHYVSALCDSLGV